MRPRASFSEWRGIAVRMAADFVLVQLAMVGAVVVSTLYLSLSGGNWLDLKAVNETTAYYFAVFCPFSLVFPAAFLAAGFYTRSRAYPLSYKIVVVVRGVVITLLLFLAANYFVVRRDLIPRSTLLPFCLLALLLLTAARALKPILLESFANLEGVPAKSDAARGSNIVLVVGGAGYIGSSIVRKLLAQGRRVRVLDSLVYGDGPIRDILGNPNFELQVGDCRNIQDMIMSMRDVSSIVHLAAIVGDPACQQDRQSALEINYAATRMMIEVAKGHGISRLLFASSCSVYGATDLLMDEKSSVQPISLYGHTKVDSEKVLLSAGTDTFHPTVLRLATVFGLSHRPRFDLVVNLLTAKALTDGEITIFNGEQWRPFIHVDDVADGFIRVLNAPLSVVDKEIFNLGDSRMNYRLSDVASVLLNICPGTRVVNTDNLDRRNYRVSFTKIHNLLSFECTRSLEHGMLEISQAFQRREITDYNKAEYHNQKFLKEGGRPYPKTELDVQVMAAFANAPTGPVAPLLARFPA